MSLKRSRRHALPAAVTAALTLLAVLATASPALAATITTSPAGAVASQVSFSAAGGETNDVTVTRSGNTLTFAESGAPLSESSDACEQPGGAGTPVSCTIEAAGTEVDAALLDLADEFDASSVSGVRFELSGGGEEDTLRGGASSNLLQGDAGADTLVGGAGSDQFIAGAGADTISGGGQSSDPPGCGDQVEYPSAAGNLRITLDDVANDDTGDGDVLTGIESLLGGNGDDTFTGNDAPNCLDGRSGADTLSGLAGDDLLDGADGGDRLEGGDGDDELDDSTTGDEVAVLVGGNGTDSATFCAYTPGPLSDPRDMTITLDGIANDGPDANDNLDTEDVLTCSAADTIFGNAEFNVIRAQTGNDTIDPGMGSDLVDGDTGDDTINARDGFADRVDCGFGNDTASVDQLDTVRNCEIVNRETRAVALEDRPPTVTFSAPPSGGTIPANRPTLLRAEAGDDRGVARVLFMDDERTVCTDTTAPYECDYQPRTDDVNRNTLAAVAIDTSDQAAFAARTVTVPRFTATRLTARTTPRRDRRRPFRFTTTGRLLLPSVVPTARPACRGLVSIQVKTGGSTISTRRTTLTRRCTYRSQVTFRVPRRLVRRALRVVVRFTGNAVIAPRTAKSYFIRTS